MLLLLLLLLTLLLQGWCSLIAEAQSRVDGSKGIDSICACRRPAVAIVAVVDSVEGISDTFGAVAAGGVIDARRKTNRAA